MKHELLFLQNKIMEGKSVCVCVSEEVKPVGPSSIWLLSHSLFLVGIQEPPPSQQQPFIFIPSIGPSPTPLSPDVNPFKPSDMMGIKCPMLVRARQTDC